MSWPVTGSGRSSEMLSHWSVTLRSCPGGSRQGCEAGFSRCWSKSLAFVFVLGGGGAVVPTQFRWYSLPSTPVQMLQSSSTHQQVWSLYSVTTFSVSHGSSHRTGLPTSTTRRQRSLPSTPV